MEFIADQGHSYCNPPTKLNKPKTNTVVVSFDGLYKKLDDSIIVANP